MRGADRVAGAHRARFAEHVPVRPAGEPERVPDDTWRELGKEVQVDFDVKSSRAFDRKEMAHDGIKARFDSRCPLCHHQIHKGQDYVVQHPRLGRYVHELCPLVST